MQLSRWQSMRTTGRTSGPRPGKALATSALPLLAAATLSGCAIGPYVEVPIEIPIDAKLDLSGYGRVLVGSFVTQTNENLDLDSETSRLLRNQLRLNSRLAVIEAEVEPLGDFSDEALETSGLAARFDEMAAEAVAVGDGDISRQEWIDLEQDKLLEDVDYWRRLGEEFEEPLIISGRLRFAAEERSGFSRRDRYVRGAFNQPRLVRSTQFQERSAYTLTAEFFFIDGRDGRTIHRERFTEEVIFGRDEESSALSSYFELMDRVLPNFLSIVTPQTFRGTRILLR